METTPRNLTTCSLHGILLTLALFSGGCTSAPYKKLQAAARAFEKSVGQQYLKYVAKDESLTEEQKLDKQLNVSVFQAALKKSEEAHD